MEATIIIGVLANIITTIVGVVLLISKIEETAKWRGWADTTINNNKDRLDNHGSRIAKVERWQSRHEGEGNQAPVKV